MGEYLDGTGVLEDDVEMPELIDLPVYREDYISQERVDELCKLVWKEQQLGIKTMFYFQRTSDHVEPHERCPGYFNGMAKVEIFIREQEKAGRIEPISMIAMVDFEYELGRRIRIAGGYEDHKPFGKPIADGPEGPLPPAGQFGNWVNGWRDKEPAEVSPERKKVYNQLCKEHPEVVFADAEARQRYILLGETYEFKDKYSREHLPKEIYEDVT